MHDARRSAHDARRSAHDARRTTRDTRRTTHGARHTTHEKPNAYINVRAFLLGHPAEQELR
eukprot:11172533-Lingulodinium_polyedra.AAC.1